MDAEFRQVREIVDGRIAELEARRLEEKLRLVEARLLAENARRELQKRGGSCEESDFDSYPSTSGVKAKMAFNYNVPPVEPRPPNLHAVNLSFAARVVIAVRDKFGGDAPKVYTAAGLSRQAYSQIVSDETRPVSKRTAIRFAFALKSTPEEAQLLLKSAGYAFSNAQTEDFILQACLEVNPPIWDLKKVNLLLQEYRVNFQY